jgi:DNA-binding NarL/FixJ family response regulator
VSGEKRCKTRILLADSHYIVRQGIRHILEAEPDFEVIGEANDGQGAVRLSQELKPDIIILEARIGKLDSVEATKRAKGQHPDITVLILTSQEDEEYIAALIAADATGCLPKSTDGDELVQAIRSVRAGDFVLEPMLAQRLFKRIAYLPVMVNSVEHLTRRELDVLKLTTKGMSNQSTASYLGISERTVRQHLMNVFSKMGVTSRTEAATKALKEGWVDLDRD